MMLSLFQGGFKVENPSEVKVGFTYYSMILFSMVFLEAVVDRSVGTWLMNQMVASFYKRPTGIVH